MTLQQLKYVSMVEKCGSFSKAAQQLYVSQPAVSNLVHALEEELDIIIFVRSSTGITITTAGRELLKLGNRLLQDADYIGACFHAGRQAQRPSFFVSSQHYDFVVAAFDGFVRELDTDRYSLGLTQTQTSAVIDNVKKQYSDLGVIFLADINREYMTRTLSDSNLEFHTLVTTKPHIFISKNHPLAQRSSVGPADLMPYPCILYDQNYESPGFFAEEMLLPNFYPEKVLYISDLYVSASLMRECGAYDIGTGLISRRLARQLACVPIDTDDTVDVGWIGIRGRQPGPLEQRFLRHLERQIAASRQSISYPPQ